MVGRYHTSWEIIGGTRVHDEKHTDVGWVDDKGDVHPTGDTGDFFGRNIETIGHVDENGEVSMGKGK